MAKTKFEPFKRLVTEKLSDHLDRSADWKLVDEDEWCFHKTDQYKVGIKSFRTVKFKYVNTDYDFKSRKLVRKIKRLKKKLWLRRDGILLVTAYQELKKIDEILDGKYYRLVLNKPSNTDEREIWMKQFNEWLSCCKGKVLTEEHRYGSLYIGFRDKQDYVEAGLKWL